MSPSTIHAGPTQAAGHLVPRQLLELQVGDGCVVPCVPLSPPVLYDLCTTNPKRQICVGLCRSLRKAADIYDQLKRQLVGQLGFAVTTCGEDSAPLLRSLTAGLFLHAARRTPDGTYKVHICVWWAARGLENALPRICRSVAGMYKQVSLLCPRSCIDAIPVRAHCRWCLRACR